MGLKIAIVMVLMLISTAMVLSYNKAIAKAVELEMTNTVLTGALVTSEAAVAQALEANNQLNLLLAERGKSVEVIHDVEIKTIEVIKEIQGECLDVAVPGPVLDSLRE